VAKGQTAFRYLSRVTAGLCLCYPSLLQAVEKLSDNTGTEQRAVYAIVLLFQNVMGHLHTVTGKMARMIIKDDKIRKRNKPQATKQQSPSTANLHEMCVSLAKLAIDFFEALDLSLLPHNKVLEGLVCVFLDHLGSSLSLVVFADADGAVSKAAQPGILPPLGLLDTSDIDQVAAKRTTEQEAHYLVTILRHLVLCIDKQQSLMRSESAPFLTLKKSFTTSNNAFEARVRDKLQNTLLRGVFGDDDEMFKDALRRPRVHDTDDDIDVASHGRDDPGEWFIGEVWRLLGWNTLAGQNCAPFGLVPPADDVV
jgi:hypothetical protein